MGSRGEAWVVRRFVGFGACIGDFCGNSWDFSGFGLGGEGRFGLDVLY